MRPMYRLYLGVLTSIDVLKNQSHLKKKKTIDGKIFNDSVHGHIWIHPLCVKIIDTPQFQRLRFLKQLGNKYLVYPGSSHNRFEHSIGVCYLAGQFVRALQEKQPELGITESDILSVEIAGLCHDLGHGPFSHFFEQKFLRRVRTDAVSNNWTHETASVEMLMFLIEDNDLWAEFEKYELTKDDLEFIKEQILGTEDRKGRTVEKCFLYEIISNKISGIDVDKWDYFARDCLMLGIKNSFDHLRLMKFARVLPVDGKRQICFRDKMVWDLYEMFHTRYMLHLRAYQHITVRCIDEILGEALVQADDYVRFSGHNGEMRKMSDAINDIEAYMKMNDYSVYFQILHSTEPGLENSRKLLLKIQKRELYTFIGQTQLKGEQRLLEDSSQRDQREKEIKAKVLEQVEDLDLRNKLENEVFVELVTLNYGKRDQNPMDNVRFYTKHDPETPIQLEKDQISQLLPEKVQEEQIRIYVKIDDDETIKCLKQAMREWCRQNKYPAPIRM